MYANYYFQFTIGKLKKKWKGLTTSFSTLCTLYAPTSMYLYCDHLRAGSLRSDRSSNPRVQDLLMESP